MRIESEARRGRFKFEGPAVGVRVETGRGEGEARRGRGELRGALAALVLWRAYGFTHSPKSLAHSPTDLSLSLTHELTHSLTKQSAGSCLFIASSFSLSFMTK